MFDLEVAHDRIKLFFINQKELPDIWQNFNFNSIEKIFKTGLIYACPYRTQDGRSLGRISMITYKKGPQPIFQYFDWISSTELKAILKCP